MKRILWLLIGATFLLGFGSASANCLTVNFDNGEKICLELNEENSNYYYANVTSAPSDATLKCDVVLPNDVNESLGACNGYFYYSSNKTETLRLYVWLNNREFKVVDAKYNFSSGNRWSSSDVGGGSSDNNNELDITASKTSPTTSQYVNVTVDTDSSYRGRVEFEVQYRASSSDTWKKQTSSSYFTADDEFNEGYRFTSSDKGNHVFSSFIRFNKSGYYRLYVIDDDNNKDYVQFNVDTSSSSSNGELDITASKTSPTTSQYVNVTVDTDSSYRGRVNFEVQYRASSSAAWTTQTSSTYFTAGDNYFKNGYKFIASDYGSHTFSSFIRFNKSGYYRLYVKDDDGNEDYVPFNVDTSSSSSNDELDITASKTSPTTSQYVNVTVDTDSSYRGRVNFEVQYRSSSSAAWTTQTSSTYFTAGDTYLKNGYKFTNSDSGRHVFSSFIRFNKSGYYRLYVKDDNGNEDYVLFNVDTSSSSSSDELDITASKTSPTTSQYVNITVDTDSSYRGRVEFRVQYRASSSDTWKTQTSSSYFTADAELKEGYKFTNSDKGSHVFNSFIRFNKNGYYRLYVEDDNNNEDYVQFNVGSNNNDDKDSNVDGFTVKELNKVTKIYKLRKSLIAQFEKESRSLRNDKYWHTLSDNLYQDMKDVINNKKNRDLEDRSDFRSAFLDWFEYTYQNA